MNCFYRWFGTNSFLLVIKYGCHEFVIYLNEIGRLILKNVIGDLFLYMKSNWSNKQISGIIAGVLTPLLVSYLIYRFRYFGDRSFFDFIKAMITLESFGKLMSLSVLPNLLLFFLAIWSERLLAARGVLIATLLFGITMVILALIG